MSTWEWTNKAGIATLPGMNMFKPHPAATPAEYLRSIADPERHKDMVALHKLIAKHFPKLKPHMQSGMIGYGSFHYKSKSGREGEWPPIALSSRAQYISVYACAVVDGKYVAEASKDKFPKASIGKSCIRFKKLADIDEKALVEVLTASATMTGMGAE
jgi:hypothetical protein